MPLDNAAACAVETLPRAHLVLAVAQAHRDGRTVEEVRARLWREDPEEVTAIFAAVEETALGQTPERGLGLLAERQRQVARETRKAAPKARGGMGLTLEQVAGRAGMNRATVTALLEHHGLLIMAPCGPAKNRRLATDAAIAQGLGHNVEPGRTRIGAVEGYGKAAPFPVFYADRLADMLWVLDLDGIRTEAAQRKDRAERLWWLLDRHGYLPGAELAAVSGYSLRAVRAAQAAQTALAGYRKDAVQKTATSTFSLLGWARENVLAQGGGLHSQVIEGKDWGMDCEAACGRRGAEHGDHAANTAERTQAPRRPRDSVGREERGEGSAHLNGGGGS